MDNVLPNEKVATSDFDIFSRLIDRVNGFFYELSQSILVAKYYVRPSTINVSSYSMQVAGQEVVYDLNHLLNILLSMIAERAMIALDQKTVTQFLKNSNWGNVYTLDFLHNYLKQFIGIQCLSISGEKLCCTFKNPLNISRCIDILKAPQDMTGLISVEKTISKKIVNYCLQIDGINVLAINDYSIAFFYKKEADNWESNLQMMAELIIRIHQELAYRPDIQTLYMSKYNPFYQLMSPEIFEDHLTPLLKEIGQMINNASIVSDKSFSETKKSRLYHKENKLYKLDCEIDHIRYLVVSPEKKEIYLSLRSYLDFRKIKEYTNRNGYELVERRERVGTKTYIKKGAGNRVANGNKCLKVVDILKNREKIATFDEKSIIVLYVGDPNLFSEGLNLFTAIYYGWMFYTSSIPNEEIPHSDLSNDDRIVIDNINILMQIYSTFISPVLEHENFERIKNTGERMETFSPGEWLINFLKNDSASLYEEKMLHLLLHMRTLIDLNKMLAMTPGSSQVDIDIRSRLTDMYMRFTMLLKVTETYVNLRK